MTVSLFRIRRAAPAIFALTVSALPWGCGGGGKSEGSAFKEALEAVESAMKPALAPWADELATTASQQVRDAGALDLPKLASVARASSHTVTEPACEAIDKHESIQNAPDSPPDAQGRLAEFVDLQAVRSLGRFPLVLYASKAPWPKSWLRDEASAPSYETDAKAMDPLFLKTVLQDRFVGPDGAFLPPEPGASDYPTLVSWLKQDSNSFDVVVFSLTDSVNTGVGDCIND